MVTFACVWVQANVPYDVEYVRRLRRMVMRNYAFDHRFVCLTDRPGAVDECEAIAVPHPGVMPGWWSKMELFNPRNGLEGRVVYLDLDSVVVDSIEVIAHYDSSFALVPHAGTFEGRGTRRVVKKYNSSVMVMDMGPNLHRLYELWTPNHVQSLWGDQDYIGMMMPNEDVMPAGWFPRVSELADLRGANTDSALSELRSRAVKVVLSKKPKNEDAAMMHPWIKELWS